uniref:uncharacterized protein LOC122609391 n=1 Tax=Erigeron canadensis TaxID=72917 RepID=UPI001CB8CE8D|nr:uncharacterized protein LOC122609391 [Erigeron canadensis]
MSNSSSSDDFKSLNSTVTQINTLFNPEIACAIFDVCNEDEANDVESSSRVPRTRRRSCRSRGSNNDINVLNESDLFDDLLQDRAPEMQYTINGEEFTKGYYLADGIYPEWATLVKSFKSPMDLKTTKFKRCQEAARKDVERAFGVFQGRWAILKQDARPYSVNKIKRMMYACVILHNMIVQDNGNTISDLEEDYLSNPTNMPRRMWDERVATQMRVVGEIRNRRTHHRLRN